MRSQSALSCLLILALLNLFHQLLAFPRWVPNRTNPIVFPTEDDVGFVGGVPPLAPPVGNNGEPLCKKTDRDTYCEIVDDYPERLISEAISYSVAEFERLFGKPPVEDSVKPRDSGSADESLDFTLCAHKSETFRPKAAVNEKLDWAFIVNNNEYIQAVTAEKCEEVDRPCKFVDSDSSTGMETRCRQRYAFKRLLAIHPNKKEAYTDSFRFPSCCVCHVTYPNVLTRRPLDRLRLYNPLNCSQQTK